MLQNSDLDPSPQKLLVLLVLSWVRMAGVGVSLHGGEGPMAPLIVWSHNGVGGRGDQAGTSSEAGTHTSPFSGVQLLALAPCVKVHKGVFSLENQ